MLCSAVQIAVGLQNVNQLRLVLEGVHPPDAGLVRQPQPWSDNRDPRRFRIKFSAFFGVDLCGFGEPGIVRIGSGSGLGLRFTAWPVIVVPLPRRRPVDQVLWNLFPLATLGAVEADPVTLNLILGNFLIAAVLEYQPLAARLGKRRGNCHDQKNCGKQTDQGLTNQGVTKGAHRTS